MFGQDGDDDLRDYRVVVPDDARQQLIFVRQLAQQIIVQFLLDRLGGCPRSSAICSRSAFDLAQRLFFCFRHEALGTSLMADLIL